jgi:hypothetical protein
LNYLDRKHIEAAINPKEHNKLGRDEKDTIASRKGLNGSGPSPLCNTKLSRGEVGAKVFKEVA